MKKIYWAGIEFSYTIQAPEFEELKGGFLYVFIKSSNANEACRHIESALLSKGMKIETLEFISLYEKNMEWETPEQSNHFLELYQEAQNSNDVILDDIYAYRD